MTRALPLARVADYLRSIIAQNSPPGIATTPRRYSDNHAPLPQVKPAAVLFSARYTAASPLSSVFWSYLTPEKILDKNSRGQLCLGTLSEGL
jgi:hypothetical protein